MKTLDENWLWFAPHRPLHKTMNSTINYQFSSSIINGIFAFLFMLSLYYLLWKPLKKKKKQEEAPLASGAWPVLGHLHKLRGPELPHRTLAAMADTHGPAFTIRLGTHRALVVSSSEVAKECFTVNDRNFSNRPRSLATKLMCYNDTMFGFASYGPFWRELRKIVMMELLSARRLESLKNIWITEIDSWMKDLLGEWSENKEKGPVVVEMREWFGKVTLNIGLKMVVGKTFLGQSGACNREESKRCLKAMRDYAELFGRFPVEDAFPFLECFDIQGYQKQMKSVTRELDCILEEMLVEHKRMRVPREAKGEKDFMDVMLSVLEDQKLSHSDADSINKSTCLNLILGTTDTTMVVFTWALTLLLNNKRALKIAQEELQLHVGNSRQVEESDTKNLVYLQAIIKEGMRLYPPEPLSGMREALDDCSVAGYHVRAGTRLIVNLWKIQRDPLVWADPLEFKPERFLSSRHKDLDLRGQHFELMPFGSGRRACPGVGFAVEVVPLILARFLHGFEVKSLGDGPVDVSESPGLVINKATPLEVQIIPRLPLQLY